MNRTPRTLLAAIVAVSLVSAACSSPQPTGTCPSCSSPGASEASSPQQTQARLTSPSPTSDELRPAPNAPAYALRDPRAPVRLAGTIHEVELAISERYATVADGFVQQLWTIGWTFPGPVLRVAAGDTVRIHLVNSPPKGSYPAGDGRNPGHRAANEYAHAVEFHGSTGAWQDQTSPLQPGEGRTFEFKTEYAGVWMYHGSTATYQGSTVPMLQSIASGMYGMMIVEPEGGLDPVSQEFFFVQSEWYVGDPYPLPPSLPSLAKAAAKVPAPDFVVLNGVANQYQDNPIQVKAGQRIRAFLLDAGPNLAMSFRVEGTVFDRVVKEGVDSRVGNRGGWGSQAVDLLPGQGAIVEFTLAEDGQYPFLSHALDLVGRGAAGMFQAG